MRKNRVLLGVVMNKQGRNESGKFAAKSNENRQVRSIRLTDSAWDTLGKIADERSITRADLVEIWMNNEYSDLQNKIMDLELELQNLKNNAVLLSIDVLRDLDKIVSHWSITREELIISLLNKKLTNGENKVIQHTQLDLLNDISQNISPLNPDSAVEFLKQLKDNPFKRNQLADRLNTDVSTIGNKKTKLSTQGFYDWLSFQDPDDIRWVDIGFKRSKGYVPADNTSIEKLQALKDWIQNHT